MDFDSYLCWFTGLPATRSTQDLWLIPWNIITPTGCDVVSHPLPLTSERAR